MIVTEKHYSKCSVFAFGFETWIKTMKLCWLLATFQSDAVSPGFGALVWFSYSQR